MAEKAKSRVCFIVRGLHDVGGIERVTIVVAGMLADVGYSVDILCIQEGEPYFSIPNKITLHYLKDEEGWSRKSQLQNWIRRNNPNVIVVSGTNRPLFILQAVGNCPIIAWEHVNATISSHPFHNLYRYFYAKRAKVVTLSKGDQDAWKKKFPKADITCIPNPVTLPQANPSTLERKCILSIGRLAGQKGYDLLIEAWSLIEQQHPDWILRIVGSGRWEKRLLKQISELGIENRIEMVPATPKVIEEYQNASVFALSSRYEGFGLVLVEAMQMGLPIVSFDCPFGPREIISDGETGILVPNGDIQQFAQALDHLLQLPDLRAEMGAEALRQVARYSPKVLATQWASLIESCTD